MFIMKNHKGRNNRKESHPIFNLLEAATVFKMISSEYKDL